VVSTVRFQTYLFYILSTLIALLLVLSTPNTRIWSRSQIANDQSTSALNQEALAELLVTTIMSVLCYWLVQGSEPGYITPEMVEDIKSREVRNGRPENVACCWERKSCELVLP
jgi:hypothetical protein